VLSAATYTGSGAVGGSHAHAQSAVACTWSNMRTALETALGLGLVGIPLAGGGSVCGTMGDYDDEVCTRLVDRVETRIVIFFSFLFFCTCDESSEFMNSVLVMISWVCSWFHTCT
jgi:hypothetical protein